MTKKKTKTFVSVGAAKTQTRDVEIVFDILKSHPEPEPSSITFGQNTFYQIKKTKNERSFNYIESGLGEFYKKGKKIFFKREYVFSVVEARDSYSPQNGNPPDIEMSEGEYLLLIKSSPNDYRQLLVSKNSVLCSTEPFTPTPVELQDNTLLGKLNNIIQSIDQNELWSILLKNNKKPVQGSIRYNKEDKCFEGYDGTKWRALMWGEE
jgi:hypothetical protein